MSNLIRVLMVLLYSSVESKTKTGAMQAMIPSNSDAANRISNPINDPNKVCFLQDKNIYIKKSDSNEC